MTGVLYPGFGIDDLAVIFTFTVIVLILLVRFFGRDPNTKRSKFGFFIERERYDDEIGDPPHVELPSSLRDDLEDTKEIPPKEGQ